MDGRQYIGTWENNNINGQGVYTWADGRIYKGEYKNDKKYGYGIYTWADGRSYEGWWYKGKQYGLGKYTNEEGKDYIKIGLKYGLWENGKRIKWFTEEEAQKIEDGEIEYTNHLKNPMSIQIVRANTRFNPPNHFKF